MTSRPISHVPWAWGHLPLRVRQAFTGRIAKAASWTALAMLIGQIIRLGGNLIMTRLLPPEMFGVMAIVLAVQITLAMLLDIGLRTALIQSPRGDDERLLNTAWTMQIIRCVVIWLITVLLALSIPLGTQIGLFPAGSTWTTPDLPLVLIVASFGVVSHGLESTNAITAERNLSLKRLVLIQLAGQFVGLILMILVGALTGSIWALVASGLSSTLVVTVLTHVALPGIANRLAWDKDARAELSRFGSWILLSSGAFVLASNADRIILGALVDPTTMGLYAIALNLAMLITGIGSAFVNSVVVPALSEVAREDQTRFRNKYFQLRLPWDIALLMSCGGLFALGPLVVQILYDDRYLAAGQMLQILALSLILFRYNFTNMTYIAAGKPSYVAAVNIVRLISIVGLLALLYSMFGFTGALFAVSLHMLPVIPVMYFFNRKLDLNSVRFEALVLLAVPVGYGAGWLLLLLAKSIIS
jgi:O-antigen/teichoic acid export membrane protein